MCTGGCLHGECAVDSATGAQHCDCHALYSGALCGQRSGNTLFELPLALTLMLALLLVGLRVAEQATAVLRFRESVSDKFAFPRRFERTERWPRLGVLRTFVGSWVATDATSASTQRLFRPEKARVFENVMVALVVALELLPWLQLTGIAFAPVVPWSVDASSTAQFFRLLVLFPMWSHLKPEQFSHRLFYFAVAAVPAGLLATLLLGLKRFPLFKPQPTNSPVEDACSMALRVYSDWAALPIMIVLLQPCECLFVGYELKGLPFRIPVPLDACFTLLQLGQMALGLAALGAYWFTSTVVVFQLNCEASPPLPTLWTDLRYASIVQTVKAPLALVRVSAQLRVCGYGVS